MKQRSELFQAIRTSGRTHLEFRAAAFNLANTPDFALPNAQTDSLNTNAFTAVTQTVDAPYDSREIQLALKCYW